jgi:hypothetical protein
VVFYAVFFYLSKVEMDDAPPTTTEQNEEEESQVI